jgi:hypothetical protein
MNKRQEIPRKGEPLKMTQLGFFGLFGLFELPAEVVHGR